MGDRAVAVDVFNDPELVSKLSVRGITAYGVGACSSACPVLFSGTQMRLKR